jgi:ABC-2 type transport system permease protein
MKLFNSIKSIKIPKLNIKLTLDMFKEKRLRYGGYAALVTLAAAVILVVVNLIVQKIPAEIDMTKNKLFSLSEQTFDLLDSLDKDVVIYPLYKTGTESPNIIDVLNKYERASDRIRVEVIDPDKSPAFLQRYESEDSYGLTSGTIIIESGDKYKVISSIDLYDVSYNQEGEARVMGFKAEQRITNGLLYVTSGYTPKVYEITGHGEYSLIQLGLYITVEKENFLIEELNLLTAPSIPEDADMIVVLSPGFDITEGEAEVLREFIEGGGSALFFFDFTGVEIPVFNSLLQSYGVEIEMGIVMEGDKSRLYSSSNPLFLAPELVSHVITSPLLDDEMTVLMRNAMPVKTIEMRRRNIEISSLLSASKDSYVRTDLANLSLQKQPGDQAGPVDLAVAIEQMAFTQDEAEGYRLVVSGNGNFIGYIEPFGTLKANIEFFLNSLSWLDKRSESISVRSKSLFTFPLQISGTMQLVYAAIFVILIPLGILLTGLIIWLRRRHL